MALIDPGSTAKSTFNQSVGVNVAGTNVLNLSLTESVPPKWPFGRLFNQPGVQTTSNQSRGKVEDTPIDLANVNLNHICDFKFTFQFGINLTGLTNPAAALAQAIKNAKLRAAAVIRAALNKLVTAFRETISAVLAILGFDPSGQVSLSISLAKDVIVKINEKIKQIAQYIEDVLVYYYLIRDIQQIIAWIQSLPDKVKALIQQCLLNFQNAVQQVVTQVQAIPGQIQGSVNSVTNSLTSGLTSSLAQLQQEAKTQQGSLDPALIPIVNGSTSNSDLANLTSMFASVTAAGNDMISTNTGSAKANTTSP
jgi:hypothetical protein